MKDSTKAACKPRGPVCVRLDDLRRTSMIFETSPEADESSIVASVPRRGCVLLARFLPEFDVDLGAALDTSKQRTALSGWATDKH